MTESEYLSALKSRVLVDAENAEPSVETIALCDEAVNEFPNSADLWVMRGILLQLTRHDCVYPLEESAHCFRQAMLADPGSAEAYEEMGHFLDAVMAKPRKAKQYFRKAWLLRRAQQVVPADARSARHG